MNQDDSAKVIMLGSRRRVESLRSKPEDRRSIEAGEPIIVSAEDATQSKSQGISETDPVIEIRRRPRHRRHQRRNRIIVMRDDDNEDER